MNGICIELIHYTAGLFCSLTMLAIFHIQCDRPRRLCFKAAGRKADPKKILFIGF